MSNPGDAPVLVRPTRVVFVRGIGQCDDEPLTEVVKELQAAGLFPDDDRWNESREALTLKPKESVEVLVGWPAVEACYTWCDRFGFRVTFELEIDGQRVEARTVFVEVQVMRVEPLRDSPPFEE